MPESPSDLVVAYRSFGRRLNEAIAPLDDPTDDPAVSGLIERLRSVLATAAAEVHARGGGDVAATASAVADAIAATPSDAWKDGQLDTLRRVALEAGGLLRQIESAVRAAG